MRIFIPTGIFHPESGGPATYLYHLLPEVIKAGHAVNVLTFGDPTPDDDAYGYPVQRIPRRALPLRPLAYWTYSRAAQVYRHTADLLYIHSIGLPLGRRAPGEPPRVIKVVGDMAWERAIRRGWIPPTTDVDDFQQTPYGRLTEWAKALRTRAVCSTDRVIVPSRYLQRMVVGWGVPEERVTVVYNALPPVGYAADLPAAQADARAALREHLPGDPGAPLLLSVARLTAWKGIGPLIRAVAGTPGVRLAVAGDGPLMPALQRSAAASGAADRIALLGRVPREQVAVWMRAADYTVLYSGYEGLSHTLLESLALGTPVIASDKGGNPEVVLHDVNGLLVRYADQDALDAAVADAVRPGVRDRLAAGASQGLERFTWDRLVAETLAVLEGEARKSRDQRPEARG